MTNIAHNIAILRRRKRMTQEDLADHLKTTRSRIGGWEENRNEPNAEMLLKLSKLFKKPINKIIQHRYK